MRKGNEERKVGYKEGNRWKGQIEKGRNKQSRKLRRE